MLAKDPTTRVDLTAWAKIVYTRGMKQTQIKAVQAHMTQQGYVVQSYTITQGNNCLWVYGSRFNYYFIFDANDTIVDIQID